MERQTHHFVKAQRYGLDRFPHLHYGSREGTHLQYSLEIVIIGQLDFDHHIGSPLEKQAVEKTMRTAHPAAVAFAAAPEFAVVKPKDLAEADESFAVLMDAHLALPTWTVMNSIFDVRDCWTRTGTHCRMFHQHLPFNNQCLPMIQLELDRAEEGPGDDAEE